MWTRVCRDCGQLDLREHWAIPDDAVTAHPAWTTPWTCRGCGGAGFALAERDEPAPDDWLAEGGAGGLMTVLFSGGPHDSARGQVRGKGWQARRNR
jgi:hypothetical protein